MAIAPVRGPGEVIVTRRGLGVPRVERADPHVWINRSVIRDAASNRNPWVNLTADGGRLVITASNGTWTYQLGDPVPQYPTYVAAHLIEGTETGHELANPQVNTPNEAQ